jgi:sporulation protein YlmC with PRC-barrel domain
MKHGLLTLCAVSLAATLTGIPAMAQIGTAPALPSDLTNTNSSLHNPIMTQAGEARATKLIGSPVYNDRGDKVGSIDDLVIDKGGNLSAILSVGGFLGVGSKYVQVPYANLTFDNVRKNNDNRVILSGATKESLLSTPGYNYYRS